VDSTTASAGRVEPVPGVFGRLPFELYPEEFLSVAKANESDMAYDAVPGRTYRFYDASRAGGAELEAVFGAGRTYGDLSLGTSSSSNSGSATGSGASVLELGCVSKAAPAGLSIARSDAASLWEGAGNSTGEATTVWPVRTSYQ